MLKKKVLHLITGIERGGGAENMLLQLLPRMQEKLENGVCVIKGEGEIGKKLETKGIPVYYLNLKNIFDWGIIFRYRKSLKEFNPDIQVNYLIHADIFGRIFGKFFGVKKIVPYIRNIHRRRKILMLFDKITLPLADFVLTNSETARKYYIEKIGAKPEKITCIPNGVDIARFENIKITREEKLKELGIPENKFIIGCVARLEKQKDIPTLIMASILVRKKHPEVLLVIVGHGSEKENLFRLIKKIDSKENILFLEKRRDMPELYQIMDVFILPSLNEGMSNAILEAMASKRTIITSNISENNELIRDNIEGLNFQAEKEKELAKKINYCLENYDKLSNLRDSAFEKVNEIYNINKIVSRLEKIYSKIAD